MKSAIQLKTVIPSFLVGLTLLCLATGPKAQAVSPPPDGGYVGGNTAEGQTALFSLTSGGYNTAVGFFSLRSNTIGSFNTATGAGALFLNASENPNTAKENTATGAVALLSNTTGFDNTATGFQALVSNTTGDHNMADGYEALLNNTTGFANTASGEEALLNNTIGSFNTALGSSAGDSVTTATHVIAIGTTGANVSHSCYIGSIAGQTVGAGGSTCYVDNDGKLGVFLSARRFKTDIADMAAASDVLLALRPVTFHYKPELDKLGIPQFGLVAEEVAKVNPDLVTHDAKGDLYTVRYEAVNAMLLNEFLKEHRTVQELKSTVQKQQNDFQSKLAEQQGQIEALTMGLQKVSAQVEMSDPAPQTVLNSD
ncbi:MAG: hypothetical protein DMF00_10510 [Verrucomicrobia bacterium]|nr:MAG: hypothetical protein DMF00_10510 [Verrucomicrobiota bacterium]